MHCCIVILFSKWDKLAINWLFGSLLGTNNSVLSHPLSLSLSLSLSWPHSLDLSASLFLFPLEMLPESWNVLFVVVIWTNDPVVFWQGDLLNRQNGIRKRRWASAGHVPVPWSSGWQKWVWRQSLKLSKDVTYIEIKKEYLINLSKILKEFL